MDEQETRRRGRFGRILGFAAIVGAGALWRQRQQQRDLDEELWGDPFEAPEAPSAAAGSPDGASTAASDGSDDGADDEG